MHKRTDVISTQSLQTPIHSFEYVLAAQPHLVDEGPVIDPGRPRVVVHNGVEDLCQDDNLASGDIELLERLADDNLRLAVRVHVRGVL